MSILYSVVLDDNVLFKEFMNLHEKDCSMINAEFTTSVEIVIRNKQLS